MKLSILISKLNNLKNEHDEIHLENVEIGANQILGKSFLFFKDDESGKVIDCIFLNDKSDSSTDNDFSDENNDFSLIHCPKCESKLIYSRYVGVVNGDAYHEYECTNPQCKFVGHIFKENIYEK